MIVDSVDGYLVYIIVIVGGVFFNNKGINCLGGGFMVLVFIDKDKEDLIIVIEIGVDYIVVLFLCSGDDMCYVCLLVEVVGFNV